MAGTAATAPAVDEERWELHRLVDAIPEQELAAARRYLEFLGGGNGHRDAEDETDVAPLPEDERQAFVDQLMGKYRGCFSPLDEFLRMKQEEVELEEARWTPQYKGIAP